VHGVDSLGCMSLARHGVTLATALLVGGCAAVNAAGGGGGDSASDQQADTLARAIGYPSHDSAAGYANAALRTPLGQSASFSLVQMQDLKAEELEDPLARLVIRIHREAQGKWSDEVDACYSLTFNYYGAVGEAGGTACPASPVSVTPPPLARRFLAGSPDNAMDDVLKSLPPLPDEGQIRDALMKALPRSPIEGSGEPQVAVAIDSYLGTIAVSAMTSDTGAQGIKCLLGTRINGESTVWRLSRAQRQNETDPPEPWPCDPQHALKTQGK
jgi:hypothetical protein